jgi:transposase
MRKAKGNRDARKRRPRRRRPDEHTEIVHPNAAGIDVGGSEHYVSVPPDRDKQPVRHFKSFTADLNALADWLIQCKITTVAMESTGVYWIPLYQILEDRGIEVKLVNARDVKCVPGRKSDVRDCEWLRRLHSIGLLNGSFRPEAQICVLRSYMRQRETLVKYAAYHVQHMQKALTQMNLKLQHVISDITGTTGMKIIRAILDGERDGTKLAAMKDWRVKNSVETIAKSLTGDYREEHLFALRQAVELYDFYRKKMMECDSAILLEMRKFESTVDLSKAPTSEPEKADKGLGRKKKGKIRRNELTFDCQAELYRIIGVDLTRINGISESTAQLIFSEIGRDVASKWKTEAHFSSWLGLCPENKISGGKILHSGTRKVVSRVANALRMCAQSLLHSNSALGAFARRIRNHRGTPVAITATAHKLARLVYRMLRFGQDYVDVGQQQYEARYQTAVLRSLEKRARKLGYQLVLATAPQQVVP